MSKIGSQALRLEGYDYRTPGYYFVTICTNKRSMFFGNVVGEKMILNDAGMIAQEVWESLSGRFPMVGLDEFVIMPDHMHGIVVIEDAISDEASDPSLISIARVFKAATTYKVRRSAGLPAFAWQKSFYDRVVRNGAELFAIQNYINLNPVKWRVNDQHDDEWHHDGTWHNL